MGGGDDDEHDGGHEGDEEDGRASLPPDLADALFGNTAWVAAASVAKGGRIPELLLGDGFRF